MTYIYIYVFSYYYGRVKVNKLCPDSFLVFWFYMCAVILLTNEREKNYVCEKKKEKTGK